MSDEIIKAEPEKSKIPVKYVGGMVHLESLDEAYRFANVAIQSGYCPKGMDTPQKVMIAIQYGAEIGLKPGASIQNICVINGKPGLYGKALPGVILATGLLETFEEHWEGNGDDLAAICHVKRKGGMERTERFTMGQAKRAKLSTKPGPWQDYPELMLRYRARGLAFNALFADCLCGLGIVEELQDIPAPRRAEVFVSEDDPLLEEVTK